MKRMYLLVATLGVGFVCWAEGPGSPTAASAEKSSPRREGNPADARSDVGRNVGTKEGRSGGTPVPQVVERYAFSASERFAMVASGAKALDVLPTRAEIEAIEDADKRAVINKAVELSERAMQADAMTDEELESYFIEMSLFSAILQVGIDYGSGRSAGIGGSQTAAPEGPPECTFACSVNRNRCIDMDCGPGGGYTYPCFCCISCNLAHLACLVGCVIQAV